MRSLRRINSSRANGARSRGPITPEGKERSSANALRHGLLAKCIVLENESSECFDELVTQHQERFAPADGVEFAMIEEMVAANWRMRRAWAIENRLMEKAIRNQPPGDEAARIAAAFSHLAASPELNLLHRYEARLHRIYQRALTTSSCFANSIYQTNLIPFPNSPPRRWLRAPAAASPTRRTSPLPAPYRSARTHPRKSLPCSENVNYQTNLIPFPNTSPLAPGPWPAPPDSGVADVPVLNYG
jgi:hypothetical protein